MNRGNQGGAADSPAMVEFGAASAAETFLAVPNVVLAGQMRCGG